MKKPNVRIAKLSEFRPQKRNANKHTQRGLGMLGNAMSEVGYVAAMTAAADGEVIDGSARLETVADKFGDEALVIEHDGTRPIITVRNDIPNANTKRAKRISLEANRIAEVDLDWDLEVLADLPEDALAGLWDERELKAMGVGDPDGDADAEPEFSRADELLEKWQTAPGQLWRIGDHRLLVGDCTVRENVERVMGGGEGAEMIWTDPPYGVAVGDKNKYLNSIARSNRVEENLENDTLDEPGLIAMLCAAFDNAIAICAAGASWYVAAPAGPLHILFGQVLKDRGIWRQTIQWVKNNSTFSPMGVCYHWQAEPIFFGWLPNGGHRYYGGRTQTTVWEIDRPLKSPEHPTMKPVELVARAIANSSQSGEIVYDPFAGSGTTGIACENLKRQARMIEIAPSYAAVILERFIVAFSGIDIYRIDE